MLRADFLSLFLLLVWDLLTTHQSAEEGTDGKQANDETFDSPLELASRDIARYTASREAQQEVVHKEDI